MAMLTGVKEAKNKIICVIDGDGQNPPYEIKKMIAIGIKCLNLGKISF